MRYKEITTVNIAEASKAQARREKEERRQRELAARQAAERADQERKAAAEQARLELARKKFAAKIRAPEPPPPVNNEPKIDPDNPLAVLYAQQQAQDREQEDEEYGVDFKFQTVVDRRTRTKRLYGFWTRERIQRLEDVMRSGQYVDLGNFSGSSNEIQKIFALFDQLGTKYRQVYVFFDRENMQRFPAIGEVLKRMKDAYQFTRRSKIPYGHRLNPETKEIEQHIAWEEVDRPPESYIVAKEQIVNEITRSPSWDNSSITVMAPTVDKIPRGARPFPGYTDFVYYMSTANSIGMLLGDFKTLTVIDTKNKKVAGKIYLSSADDVIPGAVETSDLFVYDDYQRQGIAGGMYRLLTVDLGKIVFGDRNPEGGQTPEARRLWIKMAQGLVPGVIVKGYVIINIESSSFAYYDEDMITNAIMKLGGEWLRHDNRKWVVAFNTMPNQARSELIAAIKTPISGKIYINPERGDYGDLVEEAGLVAMSTDKWQQLTGYSPE